MNASDVTFEAIELTKAFDGADVVRNVSFLVSGGEVVALVGPNGSGKSTLLNMLSGALEPDSGQIVVNGSSVNLRHPGDALRLGISQLAQFPDLCPDLSVAENIFLGKEPQRKAPFFGLINWHRMRREAVELLKEAGNPTIPPLQPAGTLSGGQKKVTTLARVIGQHPQFVLLDEPTASLADPQKEVTLEFVRKCQDRGAVVVMITHDSREVRSICSRVIAMRRGRVIEDFNVDGDVEHRLTDLLTAA